MCHLLITFSNSLNSDQARQHVRPDLDPNCFSFRSNPFTLCSLYIFVCVSYQVEIKICLNYTKLFITLMVILKDVSKKVDFEKNSADDKKACKISQHAMRLHGKCLQFGLNIYLRLFVACASSVGSGESA